MQTDIQTRFDLRHLSSDALFQGLDRLVANDCQRVAELVAHIAEVDARELYLERACSSMFGYCVTRLHMSEYVAYKRIDAGRAARRFPVLFELIATGKLHLTAVRLLAPHLTTDNHADLFAAAVHKSKAQVEMLVAERFPKADVPAVIRKVPERNQPLLPLAAAAPVTAQPPEPQTPPVSPGPAAPSVQPTSAPSPCEPAPSAVRPPAPPSPSAASAAHPPSSAPAPPTQTQPGTPRPALDAPAACPQPTLRPPASRPEIKPLSRGRYFVKLTVSEAIREKLLQAQALLRHRLPDGNLELVLDKALDALLANIRRDQFAQTSSPRPTTKPPKPGSRHIPAEIVRQAVARDGEQCSFVDEQGNRCQERGWLEKHHSTAVAKGGTAEGEGQIRILCRKHNLLEARRDFGDEFMRRKIEQARRRSA